MNTSQKNDLLHTLNVYERYKLNLEPFLLSAIENHNAAVEMYQIKQTSFTEKMLTDTVGKRLSLEARYDRICCCIEKMNTLILKGEKLVDYE